MIRPMIVSKASAQSKPSPDEWPLNYAHARPVLIRGFYELPAWISACFQPLFVRMASKRAQALLGNYVVFKPDYTTLHDIALHYIALQRITLHYIT